MPPNPMMAGHRPDRHHPGILDQTASEPARQPPLELGVVLEVTLPTVRTLEPAPTPHQGCAAAAHLQITNPLGPPIPHLAALKPTIWARRPLSGRLDIHLQAVNRVNHHPPHANTRQVQTNSHNIRHRGLLDSANWYFTDFSGASPPFQGFQPTQPHIFAQGQMVRIKSGMPPPCFYEEDRDCR